jgi:hypothetical protein
LAKLKKVAGVKAHSNTYTGNSVSFSQSQGNPSSQSPFGGGFNPSAQNPFGMGTGHQGQSTHDRVQFTDRWGMRFSTGRIFNYRGYGARVATNVRGQKTTFPTAIIGR